MQTDIWLEQYQTKSPYHLHTVCPLQTMVVKEGIVLNKAKVIMC